MDGAMLWRRVCEEHPALRSRLFFVTGDTLSPKATEFFRVPGCEALEKPFSKDELMAKMADVRRQGPVRLDFSDLG